LISDIEHVLCWVGKAGMVAAHAGKVKTIDFMEAIDVVYRQPRRPGVRE